jgi:hypothetical protein
MAVLGFGEFVLDALGQDHPQSGDVREMVSAATRAARVAPAPSRWGCRTAAWGWP